MEVQFAVDDIDFDLRNVFSVYIVSKNKTVIWGEAYNYKGKEKTVYKRNYFEGLLPEGAERQVGVLVFWIAKTELFRRTFYQTAQIGILF